jgi:hypothetical protein
MRLATFALLLVSTACMPVGVLSVDPEDTNLPDGDTDTDTDADSDTDADADADADTDADTDVPQPDFTVWEGTRNFYYDYGGGCDDTVTETGTAIQEGDAGYSELERLCSDCDWFYMVNVSPDEVCGWVDMATETYRGLVIDDDQVEVWRLDYGDATLLDTGDFDGWTIDYFYEIDDYWMEVTGQVVFPEAPSGN